MDAYVILHKKPTALRMNSKEQSAEMPEIWSVLTYLIYIYINLLTSKQVHVILIEGSGKLRQTKKEITNNIPEYSRF
jgi:hypothetical protein